MKNHLLKIGFVSGVLMLFSFQSIAQHYKGTFEISPTIGFTSSNQEIDGFTDDFKYRGGEIGLSLGYYFMKKIKIGVEVDAFKVVNSNNSDLSSSGVYFGPYVGNMITITEKLNIPLVIGAVFNHFVDDVGANTFDYNGFAGFGRTGLEIKIRKDIYAALLIGTHIGSLKNDLQGTITELDYVNLDLKLGISFYL